MSDPQIEKLLIVQDRDVAFQKIEQELTRIPQEREALESNITAEQKNIEAASQALKEKEVARNELDSEVKAKEAAIARFRTQQVEVKKNDEYRALTSQIRQSEQEIADLEERQIVLMLEIDETRIDVNSQKDEIEVRITEQKKLIDQLNEREKNLQISAQEAKAALEAARGEVSESHLSHYDRVKKLAKRPPYVAKIQDHKCGGCHLRVSNDVSSGTHGSGELSFCDQCARIVYL
jgi:predicted  nucleic acid-binding Zn-ribbon protein